MIGEFDLIKSYFSDLQELSPGLVLGIGDDAAVVNVPADQQLVVATDTLVSGVHFPEDLDPGYIAARTLLTNLSDLAAMGAEPRWFTLALTLPESNPDWLQRFSEGLAKAARQYRCSLIGGDTTRGPLTVTIAIHGVVPKGAALTRSGAQVGDLVFVSGQPGKGAAGLAAVLGQLEGLAAEQYQQLVDYFVGPVPRLALGVQLRNLASATIDVSDGLLADLGHICRLSGVGAELSLEALPLLSTVSGIAVQQLQQWVLSGGDDYELCFTVPESAVGELAQIAKDTDTPVHRIGRIIEGNGVYCLDSHNKKVSTHSNGYSHF
ncbi:thiamine-phosphate kinase [Porticoccaceae bacterium LTM1]|nr:thiamine-phosphate kinase [Porticoccaceae bacterium LTM1]